MVFLKRFDAEMLQEESENMEKVVVTTVSLAYTTTDTANMDTAV